MPRPADNAADNRKEAERLTRLARALLHAPENEMAAIYLDHALETLLMLEERGRPVDD